MRLITFTGLDSHPVLINIDNITRIQPISVEYNTLTTCVVIEFIGGKQAVKESIEMVMALIHGARQGARP